MATAAATYPARLAGCTRIHDLLHAHAAAIPDATAAVDGEVRWTYAELNSRVDAMARALIAAGVERGDRVAAMAPPSLDFWLTYLAATSVGAIWMGLNPRYQGPEYAYLLGDAEPKLVFVRSPYEGRDYSTELQLVGPDVARFVGLEEATGRAQDLADFLHCGEAVAPEMLSQRRAAVAPEDIAVIVYTSGTTGKPKGAMLSHRAVTASAVCNLAWMGADGLESTVCAAPVNHVGALNNVCMSVFAAGGRIIFHHRVDLAAISAITRAERPTYLVASPTTFVMFAADPQLGLEHLGSYRLLVFGGAATPEPLLVPVHATGIRMATVYGQTETCGIITASPFDASTAVMAETIGAPLPGVEMRIARADGIDAELGETGEIQVRAPHNMSGYFRREDATREAFTSDGFLRTGDLGLRREDGNYVFVGRLKEMFKSGGYNVYPVEIEQALAEHPKVSHAAVLPIPHPLYQEVGHAFVAPKAGEGPTAEELKEFLRPRLANYKIPKSFSFEAALPLLPNSKIDKQALKQRLLAKGERE